MKINSKKNIHRILLAVIALTAIIFTRCNKYDDLGMELLPSTDLITVKNVVIKDDISARTILEDSIRTDSPVNNLLGVIDDPVFGKTTINFASQFRLLSFPDYGDNPVADSVFLYLYYYKLYGDTATTQRIKVYELEENLIADQLNDSTGGYSDYPYYQDVDLKSMASNFLLGEMDFVPRITADTSDLGVIDTTYQLLRVPLDISLAEKLISADSLDMINTEAFLDYFKGLFIETEKVDDGGGTILSLEAARNSSFQGSAIVVYYNNEENMNNTDDPDTLSMPYIVTASSARANHIEHDYSGTPFFNDLNSEDPQDSLLYVQSTGGLELKIDIDNLGTWKDSVNTAINKAELIFKVDTTASDLGTYKAPSQLLFTIIDSAGSEYLPKDYQFSPSFYGGVLYKDDYTYRFNITQHLQQIIDGERKNNGFKLTTAFKNNELKRVVLKGPDSEIGIQLIITYSKFLQ